MDWLAPETEPSPLLPVGAWPTLEQAHEHALVVLAMGWDCSVHPTEDGYEILTAAEEVEPAKHELALYAAEQWQHRPVAVAIEGPDHPAGLPGLLIWAAALAAVFLHQMKDPEFTERFSNSSAGLIDRGEGWRPFTALFLHGDPVHLLGNLLIGGWFCLWASKALGAWRAWLLIFLGGTVANGINAALHHPQPFASIGASTATFAALGILVGLGVAESARAGSFQRLRSLAVPLVAGLMLFSLFGISGERTDIGGHAWGGLCGLTLGVAAKWLRLGERSPLPRELAMHSRGVTWG